MLPHLFIISILFYNLTRNASPYLSKVKSRVILGFHKWISFNNFMLKITFLQQNLIPCQKIYEALARVNKFLKPCRR